MLVQAHLSHQFKVSLTVEKAYSGYNSFMNWDYASHMSLMLFLERCSPVDPLMGAS